MGEILARIKIVAAKRCHCEPFAFCHSELSEESRSEQSQHTAQGKLREVPIYRDHGPIYPPPYFRGPSLPQGGRRRGGGMRPRNDMVIMQSSADREGCPAVYPDEAGRSLCTTIQSFSNLVGSCPFPDISYYLIDYQSRSVSISNLMLPSLFLSSCEFH